MNKVFKVLLVATSLAPILLTYWFIEQVSAYDNEVTILENIKSNYWVGVYYLGVAIGLVGVFLLILRLARKKLEALPVKIDEIKTADNESLTFVLVYLLPLASEASGSFSVPVLIFVAVLFFFIVMTSNSYHFNPLLNLFGYHFYEVKVSGGITYILLSRKDITNSRSVKTVHLLTEYVIIEKMK